MNLLITISKCTVVVFQSLHRGLVKKRLKRILHEENKKEIQMNWTSCYYRGG